MPTPIGISIARRPFLAASLAFIAPMPTIAREGVILRPEDFGARGDGVVNDTRAFAAMSAEINRRGGGTIALGGGKNYVVGEQVRGGQYAWTPQPIIELRALRAPLHILGNNARLICQPGLRFGTFDRNNGRVVRRALPNFKSSEVASPYRAMIAIQECQAPIEIRDLELDGSIGRLLIGGPYGDTGWQLPATGLLLVGNKSSETISNIYSHHHGQDGAMVEVDGQRVGRTRFSRFVARYNGRQGVSIIGGRGYDFEDCEFSHTGRTVVSSGPAAGVDIEAEKGPIRDLSFTRCKFIDNVGVGMVADSGDSEGARFHDCLFVGTTAWSAWPRKPRFIFERCTFVGAVVHAFADRDPARASRFFRCRFTDDRSLSPTGRVYEGAESGGPIVNLGESQNVSFEECKFVLRGKALLPWSWQAIYRDCNMSQVSTKMAMTKGKYLGHTVIKGPVDLYGSMVIGTLILNGRQIPPGPVGVEPW